MQLSVQVTTVLLRLLAFLLPTYRGQGVFCILMQASQQPYEMGLLPILYKAPGALSYYPKS